MISAGVDAGSRTIKVVLVNADDLRVLGTGIMDQGTDQDARARGLFEKVLQENDLTPDAVSRIVATGYGRDIVSFADTTITEISCHARGVRELVPDALTVIDIGGQDSKLVRLTPEGTVRDFAMNDRCAAGTGCFLEVVASRLRVSLEELGNLASRSRKPATINSTCVVFAETEIIGLLAGGTQPEDIIAGVQAAIARRVSSMAGRSVTPPVVFTGGVALVPGMDKALASVLGQPVRVSPQPRMTGALGAALLACRGITTS